jgi:RNA polymerase sigma factor (sigma-70 family)
MSVRSRAPAEEIGLEPSFDTFYRQHHRLAVRWAAALVGHRDVAEDLAHEALLQTGSRLSRLVNPGAYLRRAVVNTCRSWHRSTAREAARYQRVDPRQEKSVLSDATVEVLDLLAQLPYRHRAALVLRFWADWPDADIADALGCRESTVRVFIHRGLVALRTQLVDERGGT